MKFKIQWSTVKLHDMEECLPWHGIKYVTTWRVASHRKIWEWYVLKPESIGPYNVMLIWSRRDMSQIRKTHHRRIKYVSRSECIRSSCHLRQFDMRDQSCFLGVIYGRLQQWSYIIIRVIWGLSYGIYWGIFYPLNYIYDMWLLYLIRPDGLRIFMIWSCYEPVDETSEKILWFDIEFDWWGL